MPRSLKNRKQKGGAASDYGSLFYANTAVGGPAAITKATLQYIDKAPMFHPLSKNVVIPTGTTGIIPDGLYLAQVGAGGEKKKRSVSPKPHVVLSPHKMTVAQLRNYCHEHGISIKVGSALAPKSVLIARMMAARQKQQQQGGAFTSLHAPAEYANNPGFYHIQKGSGAWSGPKSTMVSGYKNFVKQLGEAVRGLPSQAENKVKEYQQMKQKGSGFMQAAGGIWSGMKSAEKQLY